VKRSKNAVLMLILAPLMLAACGSDDNSGGGNGAAQGVYGGTISAGTATHFRAVILDDGELWSIYGQDLGTSFDVLGFVQGDGDSTPSTTETGKGTYATSGLKDFGEDPPAAATLTADYDTTAKTISGTISGAGGSATISGGPIPGSTYSYDTAASVATISGDWTLDSLQGEQYTVSVTGSGSFTFTGSDDCDGNGTFTPRPSGKNVFNVSISFTTAECEFTSASGIAIAYPITGSGQTQLILAITNSGRSAGTAVFGIR
jgi:hypothetical protein